MVDKEWKPNFPDWSKEKRCIPCRMPSIKDGIGESSLSYTPVRCRDCANIQIFECEDCGEEIGYCLRSKGPPTLELDKKRKCNWYFWVN